MCFVFVLFSCVTGHVSGTKDVTALHVALCVFCRPQTDPKAVKTYTFTEHASLEQINTNQIRTHDSKRLRCQASARRSAIKKIEQLRRCIDASVMEAIKDAVERLEDFPMLGPIAQSGTKIIYHCHCHTTVDSGYLWPAGDRGIWSKLTGVKLIQTPVNFDFLIFIEFVKLIRIFLCMKM